MDYSINKQDKNIPVKGLKEGEEIKSICSYHWKSIGLQKNHRADRAIAIASTKIGRWGTTQKEKTKLWWQRRWEL